MSAIVGIYNHNDEPVERADLAKMIDILAHRGPDGSGIWSEGCVGLGHRMLWTTPESLLEKQPLVNQQGNLAIAADARIDNREELLASLKITDRPAEKITDTELILSVYEKWGDRCLENLLGDFAFAIWDGRKQILFCGRDHYGVKPFYYYYSTDTFVFATEIKALLCLPQIPRNLNEAKVGNYLTGSLSDNDSTLYKNIFRLPGGHHLTISPTRKHLQSYWQLDPQREIRMKSNAEYAEGFREIFTDAVRCRLRSAFPVGSHLSGGLDSSSIACVARNLLLEQGRGNLHTFSSTFETVPESNEHVYQQAVLEQSGFESHYIPGEELRPFTDDLDNIFWHQDEAFLPANFYFCWNLEKLASQLGVRVMLNGHDGDTTVSHGNEYLRELARAGKWLTLGRETREYGLKHNQPWKQVLWGWYWQYGIRKHLWENPMVKVLKGTYRTFSPRQSIPEVEEALWSIPLNPQFVEQINLTQRLRSVSNNAFTNERERHYDILSNDVMQNILEFLDRSTGGLGIEPRFPFCDRRLLEFCLALPGDQKLHQGYARIVMRRAMADILPQQVQWRVGKANFSFSLHQALLTYERDRFEEVIVKNPHLVEAYVDMQGIRQAYDRFLANSATEHDVNSLWRTACLGLWLQKTSLTP